jgi:hypothetical protein
MLVQSSKECTPPYLSSGISNLLQPAQAEVVLGQLFAYLASRGLYRRNFRVNKERRGCVIIIVDEYQRALRITCQIS